MKAPKGLYRHHTSCELGRLNARDENCKRPPLPQKHYGIRICRHHLDLVLAIKQDASTERARHPTRANHTRAA